MARREPDKSLDVAVEDGDILDIVFHEGADRRSVRESATDPGERETIRTALQMADFEIVAEFTSRAASAAGLSERRSRQRDSEAETAPQPHVEIAVAPGQSAVLLLETAAGVFAWDSTGTRRTGDTQLRRAPGRGETIRFDLPRALAGANPAPGRRGPISHWLADALIEPVRTYVLRFVATRAIDAVVKHIESGNPVGPVLLQSLDASGWTPMALPPGVAPAHPARVLLLVHGTFSSTAGSFGQLLVPEEGRQLLSEAFDVYDLVLGFDHHTLADDPTQNAGEILATLGGLGLAPDSVIDAIAFSRGGLVYRALAEQLLPASGLGLRCGKAIFVGCTNGGTSLASPANWAELVDIYTNIAIAAARGLGMLAGGVASPVLTFTIRTLGRFVQMLSEVAIGDRHLPGLAAMAPDSELIRQLNDAGPRPLPPCAYHAITSSFEPDFGSGRGFSRDLGRFVLDRLTDRLMKEPNDLVVNTASMTSLGARRAMLADDTVFAMGDTDAIYHTIYFGSEDVANRLREWLGLALVPVSTSAAAPPLSSAPSPEAYPGDLGEYVPRGASISHGEGDNGGGYGGVFPVNYDNDEGTGGCDDDRRDAGPAILESGPVSMEPSPDLAEADEAIVEATEPDVDRFISAEMEQVPKLGTPVNVYVTVSPEPIQIADHGAADSTDLPARLNTDLPLELEVIPRRNCTIKGSPRLEYEIGSREINARFQIEGMAPGEAELIVEARQGVRVAASFLLKPVFVDPAAGKLNVSQPITSEAPDGAGFAVLRIYEFEEIGDAVTLRFEIVSEDPLFADSGTVRLRSKQELKIQVSEILRELEDAWSLRSAEADKSAIYKTFLRRLSAKAKVRTARLIPEPIRRKLWQHRDRIEVIQVISEDPLIPWELMYLTDPDGGEQVEAGFFSEWGLIRWLHSAPMPGRKLASHAPAARYVIPDYLASNQNLKGAAAERAMLEAAFAGIQPVEATSIGVSDFLATEAADCDLLHFACHGYAEQKTDLNSHLLMAGQVRDNNRIIDDPLAAEQVKAEARFRPGRPHTLVFLNACQTGRSGEGLAGVSGFADAFIRPATRLGAGAFIGALWSVDDNLALTFAETFYASLKNGLTLVEAVREARKACNAQHDFTWLAYTVYGNPFARLA